MFLIIGIWGGARKVYSAFKFFLFTVYCYGVIYDLKPKLQGEEKLIKKIKESGEA